MDPLRRWWAPPCPGERRDASTRGTCPGAAAAWAAGGRTRFLETGRWLHRTERLPWVWVVVGAMLYPPSVCAPTDRTPPPVCGLPRPSTGPPLRSVGLRWALKPRSRPVHYNVTLVLYCASVLKRKKENGQPKGGMGGRHAATTETKKERKKENRPKGGMRMGGRHAATTQGF